MAFRLSLYWWYEGVAIMSFTKSRSRLLIECDGSFWLSFVPERTTRDGHLNASFIGSWVCREWKCELCLGDWYRKGREMGVSR